MKFLRGFTLAVGVLLCASTGQIQGRGRIPSQREVTTGTLTFTTISVPRAGFTVVTGINAAGDMVGTYGQYNNGSDGHGFLLKNGTFSYFDYPGAMPTYSGGINDSGVVAGTAEFEGGLITHGFLYDGQTYSRFDFPGQPQTAGLGINNAGVVVGATGNFAAGVLAFKMQDRRFQRIYLPRSYGFDEAVGINNLGEIAAISFGGLNRNGFEYRNGKTQQLNFPGATWTGVSGINDYGIAVGYYFVLGKGVYGFAYQSGKYVSFAVPGAQDTYAAAINASGQIVGQYVLPDYSAYSFVSSPISAADFQH